MVSDLEIYNEELQTFEPLTLEQLANFLVSWLQADNQNFHWLSSQHEWATFLARNGFKASPPIYGQKINSQVLWPAMGQISSYAAYCSWLERYERTKYKDDYPVHQ